jgi:hypothetical protein
MANRKDLLSEAIADAKAVKETALANAKLALEEAFTPKLQSMISAKLAEEADEDEMEDEKEDDTAVAVEAEMDSEVPTDGEEVTEEEGEEEHKVKTDEKEDCECVRRMTDGDLNTYDRNGYTLLMVVALFVPVSPSGEGTFAAGLFEFLWELGEDPTLRMMEGNDGKDIQVEKLTAHEILEWRMNKHRFHCSQNM